MRYRKGLSLIIALCVFLIALVATDARADYAEDNPLVLKHFEPNDVTVLDEPSVTADRVTTALDDDEAVKLVNTKVLGDLDLSTLDFDYFGARDTVFSGDVTYSCLQAGNICSIRPRGEDLQFIESVFEGQVNLAQSNPERARFRRCNFKQKVNFHSVGTTFPEEEQPLLYLDEGIFDGDAIFVNMDVKSTSLVEAHFRSTSDFAGAQLGTFDVTRLRADEPIYIRWWQFGNVHVQSLKSWAEEGGTEERSRFLQAESSLLFWKNNFTELGYQSDARDVNYEIIRLRREHPLYLLTPGVQNAISLSGLSSLLELISAWVMALVIGLPSKFGAAPYLPLGISIVLIPVFAAFYWIALAMQKKDQKARFIKTKDNPQRDPEPLPLFSLLYSIDTFVPFVTLTGVKDWGWTTTGRTYWLVELPERFIGFAIFTAAAFSVGSYVI